MEMRFENNGYNLTNRMNFFDKPNELGCFQMNLNSLLTQSLWITKLIGDAFNVRYISNQIINFVTTALDNLYFIRIFWRVTRICSNSPEGFSGLDRKIAQWTNSFTTEVFWAGWLSLVTVHWEMKKCYWLSLLIVEIFKNIWIIRSDN